MSEEKEVAKDASGGPLSYHTDWSPESLELPEASDDAQEPQVSEAEAKARNDGWVPESEYKGDAPWVGPEEYNFRGELFGRIKQQSKQLKSYERKQAKTDAAIEELKEYQSKISEIEYKRALDNLRYQKTQATEEGNTAEALAIDEQMADIKEEHKKAKEQVNREEIPAEGAFDPVLVAWIEDPKNSWYHTNEQAREYADAISAQLYHGGTVNSSEELIEEVEKRVHKTFPNLKGNNRTVNPVTEGGTPPVRSGKTKYTQADLTPEQLKAARRFKDQKIFKSIQEYVDDAASHGLIEGQ